MILAANLGMFATAKIQAWGTAHLGWFDYPCNDLGGGLITSCMAPAASPGWAFAAMAIGATLGVGLWLAVRVSLERRRPAPQVS
ncbi:MAG TPA: hypothetical protein VIG64_05065 [Actinomycetota bacterium]